MKRFPRPRLTLFTAMAVVALFAVLFACFATEDRKRIMALTDELHRAEDRVRSAEHLHSNGFLANTALAAERAQRDRAQLKLKLELLGGTHTHIRL